MDISNFKAKMDFLFDELIFKLSNHGSCVQSCKDDYAVCLMKCEDRMNDWGCTATCREKLESCINSCPNGLTEKDKELVKEYLDKIEAVVTSSK